MSNPKELRKQLRNVVQELLPDLLNSEQHAVLKKHIDLRISELEKHVKKVLADLDERHRDTMSYLVRNVSTSVPTPKTEENK